LQIILNIIASIFNAVCDLARGENSQPCGRRCHRSITHIIAESVDVHSFPLMQNRPFLRLLVFPSHRSFKCQLGYLCLHLIVVFSFSPLSHASLFTTANRRCNQSWVSSPLCYVRRSQRRSLPNLWTTQILLCPWTRSQSHSKTGEGISKIWSVSTLTHTRPR
jgi:hypothetical protein